MTPIAGNTYPVREKLKALGGKWSAARNCWLVPDDKADEARALVPAGGGRGCGTFRPRVCGVCGCRINYGRFCGKCEFAH